MNNTNQKDSGIHSRAILVRTPVSTWDGRRFDKKITDEVNTAHAASREAGRYNKHLLGGKKAAPSHANAISAGGAVRQALYAHTLAWADDGWRLLPMANYDKFIEAIRKAKSEFEQAIDLFIDDYPTVEALRGKFRVDVEFTPVPSEGDFRLDLPDDQLNEIASSVSSRVERATKDAMHDAWTRLREAVEHVRERLTGKDAKGKDKTFRDSLIGNAVELADVLSRLNVTNDPDLEAMRKRVAEEIASLDPKSLRTNSQVRTKAAKSANEILDAMKGLYGGK